MTRKDYILIAKCIVECHNENYDLEDTIGYFCYRLHGYTGAKSFDLTKFKSYILERTKPDHIPDEQAKGWAIKKCKKLN